MCLCLVGHRTVQVKLEKWGGQQNVLGKRTHFLKRSNIDVERLNASSGEVPGFCLAQTVGLS